MWKVRCFVAASLAAVAPACVSHVKSARLENISLPQAVPDDPQFGVHRILLRRFSDGRPEEFSRRLPGAGVFVGGSRAEYPLAFVDEGKRGASTVHHGSLPHALPFLIARSLPGDNVRIADALPDAGANGQWDYIVDGRLLQTRDTYRSGAVWVYAAPLGVPTAVRRYQMSYELSIFEGDDPDHPILSRKYAFDERVSMGLYRSGRRANELPLHALQTIVARSAEDLVLEVAKHRARDVTSTDGSGLGWQGPTVPSLAGVHTSPAR